jgi:bifunctional non-homologous end joining protein LigD
MLASSAVRLPQGVAWSYEVKFDGYRTLALKDGPRIKLLSRNLKDATRLYPSVAREVSRLRTEAVLIDGEVVAVDEEGRPSFQALHHLAAHTVVYYAFDLLHLDGRDLTTTPLDERRELLAKVLKGSRLLRSEPLPGRPEQIEKAVRASPRRRRREADRVSLQTGKAQSLLGQGEVQPSPGVRRRRLQADCGRI